MKKSTSAVLLALAAGSASAVPVAGTSSGTWVNPIPSNSIVQGVGTSTFQWGALFSGPSTNRLVFTGPPFSGDSDGFKVASITYFNGTTKVKGLANQVSLRLAVNLTLPGSASTSGDFDFGLKSTPNVSWYPNSNANADFVMLPSIATTVPFDIDGATYELELTDFRNVVGDGFLTSGGSLFHVREQKTATADLYGRLNLLSPGPPPPPPPPIPEPETYAMMLAGLGMLGLMVARRRKLLS